MTTEKNSGLFIKVFKDNEQRKNFKLFLHKLGITQMDFFIRVVKNFMESPLSFSYLVDGTYRETGTKEFLSTRICLEPGLQHDFEDCLIRRNLSAASFFRQTIDCFINEFENGDINRFNFLQERP